MVAGYCTSGKLGSKVSSNTLVYYSKEDIGSIMEELAGDAGRMTWMHHGDGIKEPFPDEDDNIV